MEQTQHKKVGIIGGMGPLATADLFEKITHLTKADADSKHIHVIIDSDTSIPDRTAAILGLGPDPTDELKAAAKPYRRPPNAPYCTCCALQRRK